jgi:pSer/pThr/pTyr-binding forkhead associated (FHA) protein
MMTTETYQFTVGSSQGCEVIIDNPSISRAHLKVYFSGDSILVEDMGSSSGTYVLHDGEFKRIKSAKIKPETKIRLGSDLNPLEMKDIIELYHNAIEKDKRDILKRIKSGGLKRCFDCGTVLSKIKIHCECCGAIFEEAA